MCVCVCVCVCVRACVYVWYREWGGAGLTVGFNRDIRTKFGILNLPQSPDIGSKSDGHIFDFNMKHGPVTKIGNKSKTMLKKFEAGFRTHSL